MTSVTSSTRNEWSTRLAQALVDAGYETESKVRPLLNEAIANHESLAYLLISRNLGLPSVVIGTLAQLSQLPAVDLSAFTPEAEATAACPPEVGREFDAVGLQFDGNALAVAFAEPPSPEIIDELAGRVGHRIHPVLADPVLIAGHLGTDGTGRRSSTTS